MIAALAAGLAAGLGLIVVIGAQNAFVLRQGLLRRDVAAVVGVCTLSDWVLITAGVAGVGALVQQAGALLDVVRFVGAAFLLGYAGLAFRRAARPGSLIAATDDGGSSRRTITAAVALTWLNPHVYLDTVVLLGAIGSTHGGAGRWWFAVGAGLASLAWFSGLGFGTRPLAPLLSTTRAWRVLDIGVGLTMMAVAASLVVHGLHQG